MVSLPDIVQHREAYPSPISLPPSYYWDGNDGSWSTFALQIGSYPHQQVVRVLPSTSGNSIWVVVPEGCTITDPVDCPETRGSTFTVANSSTWEDKGLYTLPLNPLHDLPYSGNGVFGFDNVTLDWPGRGGVSLSHQVIAGIATKDFYLGYIGLSSISINISSYNDGYPSLLGTLRSQNLIPSSTYGYTAGASYRSYPINSLASLTLGGYDSTRLNVTQNVTSSGQDTYRPMLLGLSSITLHTNDQTSSNPLLTTPIITALDSTITELWLPTPVCDAFESAFNLTYNATLNLYTVPPSSYNLSTSNPLSSSLKFTLTSGSPASPSSINITLPLSAFSLHLNPPNSYFNTSGPYFPLRRAANASQFILGRTFLQEAYLIADYDRGAFSVFPAVYPDVSVDKNVVPILPPPPGGASPPVSASRHGGTTLSTAGLVAVICASVLIALLALVTVLFRWRRSAKRGRGGKGRIAKNACAEKEWAAGEGEEGSERDGGRGQIVEAEADQPVTVAEMDAGVGPGVEGREAYEVPGREGDDGAVEMEIDGMGRVELDGRTAGVGCVELKA